MSTPRSRRAATTPKGAPPQFRRCLAKAITTGSMINDLFYRLEVHRLRAASPDNPKPTPEGLAGWDGLRVEFGEILLAHLDAYDQKET
jgi:hypothetical protein